MTTVSPRLRATTILTPAILVLSACPAMAATTVGSSTTTPLLTSTAGDVTVSSGGTITVSGGAAVTVDSTNSATVASGGTLAVGDANGASGIAIASGTTSTVSNAGAITVLESFTGADLDGNGIADGTIAQATDRAGIRVVAGSGAAGSITNTGTITVEGLNSAGIAVDAPYSGSISNTGVISVKGDSSAGIRTGAVSGNVVVGGTVTAVGAGAQAVVLSGDIGGTVTLKGTISQATSYTTDAATTQILSRTALNNGAAAVAVEGNVAGGILVFTPSSTATTSDTTGAITSYGTSPALLIGGTGNTTIGTVASNDGTYSLAVDGSVASSAYYSSTNAYGVVIGGQGGTVTMNGGIGVNGTVTATTVDSAATALLINTGAYVPSLYVSGTIKATISSPGLGASYAVRDLSGSLTTINNTGFIVVSGSSEDKLAAIDLSANTSGVTISQYLNATDKAAQVTEQAASGYTAASAVTYTAITGAIYTGSGNDLIDIQSGKVTGNMYLGTGDDTVKLSGDSKVVGDIHFGSGAATMTMAGTSTFTGALDVADQAATLAIADTAKFAGTLTGGSQLAVSVTGGSFGANAATTLSLNSLTVGSGGTVTAYIDGSTGTSSLFQVGTATFASGSKIAAKIDSLASAAGSYHILTATTLTGTPTFDSTATGLPLLFKGTLTVEGNDIMLDITRKSATELGLTSSQSQGYEAIYAAALNSATLASSLLQASDMATLQGQMSSLLPDHSGGVFDFMTRGARLTTRHLTDDSSLFDISDAGGWLEPVYFHGSKKETGTAAYTVSGGGLSTGFERVTGIGNVGVSFAWLTGSIKNGTWQSTKANSLSLGAFWRHAAGPLYAFAQVGGNKLSLKSTRTFTGEVDSAAVTLSAAGSWKGWGLSSTAGASWKFESGNFSLKPMVVVDYYRLHETGYAETGSTAIALTVDGRTSSALSAATTLTAGWSKGESSHQGRPFTVEVEAGRRNHLSGTLGTTTASFADGSQFSITPDALKSGWIGEARILQGGMDYTWKLAAGAEHTVGGVDYSGRASLSIAF
jgi:hypothetical protein